MTDEDTVFDNSLIINRKFMLKRSAIVRTDKHKKDNDNNDECLLIQYNLINQFHEKYENICERFHAPRCCCGFFSTANVLILERLLLTKTNMNISCSEVNEIVQALTNESKVDLEFYKSLSEILQKRKEFYHNDKDLKKYLSQWVANYEIGDHLRRHSTSIHTHFYRNNQFPFIQDATPDEAPRIENEKRFGGKCNDLTGTVTYDECDSEYFYETNFINKDKHEIFYSPENFSIQFNKEINNPQLFIVDLSGHFAIALACKLEILEEEINKLNENPSKMLKYFIDKDNKKSEEQLLSNTKFVNTVILFNSSNGIYLNNQILCRIYDQIFIKK